MEVSLTQAFAFLLPGITVTNSCGMADESKSQPNEVAIIMLTVRFYSVAPMSQTQAQTSAKLLFSLQGTKIKENKMTVAISPLFTLIIQSLATRVSTLGHTVMTVVTLKKPNL